MANSRISDTPFERMNSMNSKESDIKGTYCSHPLSMTAFSVSPMEMPGF